LISVHWQGARHTFYQQSEQHMCKFT